MSDWKQKRDDGKLVKKTPNDEKHKLVEIKDSPTSHSRFTTVSPSNRTVVLLGYFGKYKTRGHSCLCKMNLQVQSELDTFFKKIQHNSCDVETFSNH